MLGEKERNSPLSSSEPLSGSASPHVVRLPTVPPSKKQRSSSMNSVSSNHSTHQRSMSIISLESPRNSIVSLEDNFLRPTRNNSTNSLASLSALSPFDSKDTFVIGRKVKSKASSAVFSDEDSELELQISVQRAKWRRRSSEKIQKPSFLASLKKDFKFKYDNHLKPKSVPPNAKFMEDGTPSPLSIATDGSGLPLHRNHQSQLLHHTSMSLTSMSHTPMSAYHNPGELDYELPAPQRAPGKKLRTSSITQSIFMKKRMLLSKDIQLELLLSHSPAVSPPTHSDARFPVILQPLPLRGQIHNLLSLHRNDDAPQSPPMRSSPSPPPLQIPSEPSVRQQNKLIYELNRKWNKAVFDTNDRKDKDLATVVGSPSRKRERSELVSSSDSFILHG